MGGARDDTAPPRQADLRSLAAVDVLAADPNPILLLDAEGRIAYANDAAADLTGYPRDELVGLPVDALVPDDPSTGPDRARWRPFVGQSNGTADAKDPVRRLSVTLRRRDGSGLSVEAGIGRLAGEAPLSIVVLDDVTIRRAAERRVRLLAELGVALSAAATLEEVATAVVERASRAFGSIAGWAGLIAGDELLVLHALGLEPLGHADRSRVPLSELRPITDAIRLRRPVVVRGAAEMAARYPLLAGAVGSTRVAVPLIVGTRPVGALSFAFDSPDAVGAETVGFLETIAFTCAQAFERARLYSREREAHERVSALAVLNGSVLEARSPAEVATLLLNSAIPTFHATRGALWLLAPDGGRLELLEERGDADDGRARPRSVRSEDDDPVARAVRTGTIVSLPADGRPPEALLASIVIPLAGPGRTIGALALDFDGAAAIHESEIAHLRGFVHAGATAIARATLDDQERRTTRLLETVIGQLPVGLLVVLAPSGRVLFANRFAAEVLGFVDSTDAPEPRSILPEPGTQPSPPAGPILTALREGVRVDDEEIVVPRADGRQLSLLASAMPVRDVDGRMMAAVSTFADITSRVQAAAVRDAFIGVLSHELRTPVTTIYAGAKLLELSTSLDRATQRELAADVAAESERLQRLVEDLLVLTRIERGADLRRADPVLIGHIVRHVVDQERARWPGIRFRLHVATTLPPASGDEGYVEQIVRNLLSNAAKYGPADGTVSIRVARDPEGVAVRVADQGPGILEGERERIFELFYRAPSTAGRAPGAGIGLYACRALVGAMGGRIWAGSAPRGGAEVGFVLPVFVDVDA